MAKEGSSLTAGAHSLGLALKLTNAWTAHTSFSPTALTALTPVIHLNQEKTVQPMLRDHLWTGPSVNMVAADHRRHTTQRDPMFSEGWPSVQCSQAPLPDLALGVPHSFGALGPTVVKHIKKLYYCATSETHIFEVRSRERDLGPCSKPPRSPE